MSAREIPNADCDLGGQSADEALDEFFTAVERDIGWTLHTLSEMSGIPHDTLKDYRRAKSKPGFEATRKLITVTPPAIGALLLGGTGRTLAALNPRQIEHARLQTLSARFNAKLAEAREDGFVDHREHRNLVPDARELRDAADGFIRQAHD